MAKPLNPWGITKREGHCLDAIIAHGSNAEAARFLRISLRTLENLLLRAYYRMGLEGKSYSARVLAMRLWLTFHGVIVG